MREEIPRYTYFFTNFANCKQKIKVSTIPDWQTGGKVRGA